MRHFPLTILFFLACCQTLSAQADPRKIIDRGTVNPIHDERCTARSQAFVSYLDETTPHTKPNKNLETAHAWLQGKATEMIHACRMPMNNHVAAFPPQVGSHYNAFWLRDYAYMLEGRIEAFTDKELIDACRLFVAKQKADGACVDCIKYDGTPIYKPGYGTMGEEPVADGSQFTIAVAWHTYQRTKDRRLLEQVIDRLVKAMQAVPRNKKTGLVFIRPGATQQRCPYGFTDTIGKQGDILFCSLLDYEASCRLADLLKVLDRSEEARQWRSHATQTAESIRHVFWDPKIGLFRAATVQCRQPDIWGSAMAVYLEVATPQQSHTIALYFKKHYHEIVQCGQLRHLPGGIYWEKARAKDAYQNGAYWATPVGWFVYTLDLVDPRLADQTVLDMVHDFQKRGVTEWVFNEHTAVPNYVASATLPLAGIRKMLERRKH